MLRIRNLFVFTMASVGLWLLAQPSAMAAIHDGVWSVLIITEKGNCDHAFRYNLNVTNGEVRYQGDGGVRMSGKVAPNGHVNVSIRLGDQGADGSGRLSGSSGKGTWRGIGGSGACAGRWEAERR